MSGVNYSLGAGKPLISREQNYVLDRKLLTIHSEDRDITKWPNANEFEIVLPQQLLNIQSMRLVEIQVPTNLYVFSNLYQNTIMDISGIQIQIQEGTYTPDQLVTEINTDLSNNGLPNLDISYNPINQKFSFINTYPNISLNFATQIDYSMNNTSCPVIVFNNYANWGLPYNLGFNKQNYNLTNTSPNNTIEAPSSAVLSGDKCIYMEVDKYNSYDELYPYNESTFSNNEASNTTKKVQVNGNNAYNGQINSAFAKIPLITYGSDNYVFESRNIGLQNITHYDPPLERLGRLKFKFRFHDGRLVDFQNNPFNFTLEFNMLRSEMGRQYNVRIPLTYTL
jgi:hypothetical protein